MDTVRIEELKVDAVIGVYDWERTQTQPLILDLSLGTCFDKAFGSDDLNDALDYANISQEISRFCEQSRYALLEKLAGDLLEMLFARFPIEHIKLRIRKPQAIAPAMAAIECERSRDRSL